MTVYSVLLLRLAVSTTNEKPLTSPGCTSDLFLCKHLHIDMYIYILDLYFALSSRDLDSSLVSPQIFHLKIEVVLKCKDRFTVQLTQF